MSWPEIVSDAVKIGLGAIVGGIFAIIGAKQAHRIRMREEYSRRRRDQLEKISESFDAVSRHATEHVARLHSITGLRIKPEEKEAMLTAVGFDPIEDQKRLGSLLDGLHSIEARLALLALAHVAEEVERYRHILTDAAIEGADDKRKKGQKQEIADIIHKQRTVVISMMALAYKDA